MKFGNSRLISIREAACLAAASPRCALAALHDKLVGPEGNTFPRNVLLYVTERCNFACPMCANAESRADRLRKCRDDMPLEMVNRVAEECAPHGSFIDLFGGEPLLYGNLKAAIQAFAKRRMLTFLTTNGLVLKQRAAELVEGGLHVLSISIDGWDDASQEKRGRVPGSFGAIAAGVEEMRKVARGRLTPMVRASTVITRDNCHAIDEIAKAIYGLGIRRWVLGHYFFATDAIVSAHKELHSASGVGDNLPLNHIPGSESYLSESEIGALEGSLERTRALLEGSLRDLSVSFNWAVPVREYYSPRRPSKESKCHFPFTRADITPDGRVTVCSDGYTVGTVGGGIGNAWTGPKMRYFRQVVADRFPMPMCFRCCGIRDSICFADDAVRPPLS